MTTSVKVEVHKGAEWDAEVIAVDYPYPRTAGSFPLTHTRLYLVQPGEEFTVHCTSTRDILVREKARALRSET